MVTKTGIDKSIAPAGFARTHVKIPAKRNMLVIGLIILCVFALLALNFSYRAIFVTFNVFSLFVFIVYLVMWFEGAYKNIFLQSRINGHQSRLSSLRLIPVTLSLTA